MRAQERHLANPVLCGNVHREKLMGALVGNIQGYTCPRCQKNYGFIHIHPSGASWFCGEYECLQDDKEYEIAVANKEKTILKKSNDASEIFGLGSKYYNACLSKCRLDSQYIQAVSEWLANPKKMIILLGTPGTGKTYFCAAVANYFLEMKKPVHYTNVRRFIEKIQSNINSGKNQYEAISKLDDVEILIFDDLGASTNSEWQQEMILDIVDRRYSSEKPTIFTSNLSFEQIKKTFGERVERRLNARTNLKIIVTEKYDD